MQIGKITHTLLLCSGFFAIATASAQSEPTPVDSKTVEEPTKSNKPDSQEVEYNDQNYRRFMELKDQPGKRNSLPTNTYQSGTQKLDKLPESSQKHLRNQLREIILDEAEWAPGDENKEYPYVASDAAEKDPTLQQQELEAWGELVGKYHQREAQIYARANGREAGVNAAGMANNSGANNAGSQPTGENAEGDGSKSAEPGDGEEQQKAGQQNQAVSAGSYSPSTSTSTANANDSQSVSNSGVSQSALQYLLSKQLATEPGQLVVTSKNTLSIQDLQNAQGIYISVGGSSEIDTLPSRKDDE